MTTLPSAPVLISPAAQSIFNAGERGPLWRLISGQVRIDHVQGPSRQLMLLALPGDLIGTESLCGQAYRYSATALTPAQLEPVRVTGPDDHAHWLRQAVMQQHLRSQDMAALRTGQVTQRLSHLLHLLGHAWPLAQGDDPAARAHADHIRASLPPLRELAEVIDAQHETVCRALGRLLPRTRKADTARHGLRVVRALPDAARLPMRPAHPFFPSSSRQVS